MVEGVIILFVLVIAVVFLLREDFGPSDDPTQRVQDAVSKMSKLHTSRREKIEQNSSEENVAGFFGGVKSTFKKSEAAVVVQNLLEHQARAGFFSSDPAQVSNKLVEAVWSQRPDMFEGAFGQRPHKISVAAAALANGVFNLSEDNPRRVGLALALGNLLSEVELNGKLYPFNGIDYELLDMAMTTFSELDDEVNQSENTSSLSPIDVLYPCILQYREELQAIGPLSNQANPILGYFFGALDEICAALNKPSKDFDDALYQVFSELYKGKVTRALQRAGQLREQRDRVFLQGEALGKAEFFNLLNRENYHPTGLHEYIYEYEED